jgi:phage-related protein
MKWRIELYKTISGKYPVLNFMQFLSPKKRAKIEKEIDLLELHGIYLPYPYTRKIRGDRYKDLCELRISSDKSQFRIIYFLYMKNVFVLIHAFCKKKQKTPKNELEIARGRMIDFLARKGEAK